MPCLYISFFVREVDGMLGFFGKLIAEAFVYNPY